MKPLVSVICISYNHAPYIKEALNSLFAQTYANIEIILMDDASTDDSQTILKQQKEGHDIKLILHTTNQGYTKTFNQGLKESAGAYIIDFSLDDVMEPELLKHPFQDL